MPQNNDFDLCPAVPSVPGTSQNVVLPRQAPKQKDSALSSEHPGLKNKTLEIRTKMH